MKATIIAAGALLIAIAVYAHEDEAFEGWMKQTNKSYVSAQKGIAAKQTSETAAAGEKLAELFEHVRSHFEGHKMADGIGFAKTAHDAAKDLAADANAGNWEKASADIKTIGTTCQGCHAAHRVKKANGEWEMK
jgi:cytochrome c556